MAVERARALTRRATLQSLLLLGPAARILAGNPGQAAGRGSSHELTFSSSEIELTLDRKTGAWLRLMDQRSGSVWLESAPGYKFFSLTAGGKASRFPIMLRPSGDGGLVQAHSAGARLRLESHELIDAGTAKILRVKSREGDWVLVVDYRVWLGERRVDRRFRLTYTGSDELLLRRINITLPIIKSNPEDIIHIPASSIPPSLPFDSVDGQALSLGDPGLLAVRDSRSNQALLFFPYSETETPRTQVVALARKAQGVKVSYRVKLAARMKTGTEVAWGSDHLWILDGEWLGSLQRFQRWWTSVGVRTPENRPKWVEEEPRIYETQIGAALFDRGKHQFNPYPTIRSLIDRLDYIRDLGFNTVELMPRHPCPSYAVYDYFDPVHQYGDDAGLKILVEEVHRRGMRIILDWIVHGVIDKELARKTSSLITSVKDARYQRTGLPDYVLNFAPAWIEFAPEANPLRIEHPNWFMKREDGSLAYIYTWAFDLENQELQDYIISAMKFYIQRYDVDGFRVDAPTWNSFPNWDTNIPYRASLSETGGIRLFDRARPILRSLKPDLMLYTEPTGPAFRRMFDVNYSYDELPMMERLLAWRLKKPTGIGANFDIFAAAGQPNRTAAYQFRLWLENRRLSLPKGSETIHQVDSHDSFWWLPWGFKFRREQYGVAGYRALFFMLSTLDGGLMQYPTGEEGSEAFVKRALSLRQSVPELRGKRCDYLKVKVSDDSVFAVSWEAASGWAIPLTNFGEPSLKVRVSLPRAEFHWKPNAAYLVQDVFSHKPVNGGQETVLRGPDLENMSTPLDSLESALLVVRERKEERM
jgi:hypothetical protein